MLEEPFAAGNSVIHGLDPRFRAASAIVYCIIVASVYRIPALGFALAVSISMILLARLELKRVFYRLL
ncbi:MAG: cobalt ECF transporter T component CbiQ, partial [Desulfosalsimonas sp.]